MQRRAWSGVKNLNILPYGIWNIDAVPCSLNALIWTFFPMGFETFLTPNFYCIIVIWTFFPMGFETLWLCLWWCLCLYLNILPYGIWNTPYKSNFHNDDVFEHSSLWDLKHYSTTQVYSGGSLFEHSSLWDLKRFEACTFLLNEFIWTFFPMGFETISS